MEPGTIMINMSDLFDLKDQIRDRDKTIANIAQDRQREEKEMERLQSEVGEMSRIYEQDKSVIAQLQARKFGEDVYDYIDKHHSRLTRTRNIKPTDFYKEFDAFMKEFLERKDKEADNDDLPF